MKENCGRAFYESMYPEEIRKKISVIIPCYNAEKYIDRCLKSIEAQTCGMDRLEVILVDDVSKDDTSAHLLAFEKKYPDQTLVVSCQENGGPGRARNIGMEYASGEYITFVDADDMVDPTMLQKMYEALEERNCEVAECGYNLFTDREELPEGERSAQSAGHDFGLNADTGRARGRLILTFFKSAVWGRLYRRSFLEKAKLRFPDQMSYGEDNLFSGLTMLACSSYYYIREPLYFYYNNAEGIMGGSRGDERIRQLSEGRTLFLAEIYRRGFLDGRLDECAGEFEWYMIYKYFIDPVRFILAAQDWGWEEQVRLLSGEILKLFPKASQNGYLIKDPKWKEYVYLLRQE